MAFGLTHPGTGVMWAAAACVVTILGSPACGGGSSAPPPSTPPPATPTQPLPGPTATVDVDEGTRIQGMEGFGGFGPRKVWWDAPPFYDSDWINLMLQDWGLTILRDHIPENFMLAPGSVNIDQSTPGVDGKLGDHLPYLRDMGRAGLPKLITSIWSPPAWMKTNGTITNGGALRSEDYPAFADYCVRYVRTVAEKTGVDVYGLSVQNEPAFEEPYASCVYTPAQLTEVVKAVGARFRAEGISTRLFVPEDVEMPDRIGSYINAVCGDPEARADIGFLAIHGYSFNGVTPGSSTVSDWQATASLAAACGKPLWLTETSGYSKDWKGALELAQAIYVAIQYGHVSAWVYWYSNEIVGTSQYDVSKNYYRFVRPGAVHVDSRSDNPDVLALAFRHDGESTVTVLLINKADAGKTVTLHVTGGPVPSRFRAFRSSAGEHCDEVAPVGAGDAIALPASSVTTLYGETR